MKYRLAFGKSNLYWNSNLLKNNQGCLKNFQLCFTSLIIIQILISVLAQIKKIDEKASLIKADTFLMSTFDLNEACEVVLIEKLYLKLFRNLIALYLN